MATIVRNYVIGLFFMNDNLIGDNYLPLLQSNVVPTLGIFCSNPESSKIPRNIIGHFHAITSIYTSTSNISQPVDKKTRIDRMAYPFTWFYSKANFIIFIYIIKNENYVIRSVTPELQIGVRNNLILGCCEKLFF